MELAAELETAEKRPVIIPGAMAGLTGIARDQTATLGLVTGNYTRAVPLKLRAVGIDPEQFVVGAFGDDAPTRPELVRLAMDQWKQRGAKDDPRNVVVIGDTPRDVDCAKKNGCRSIAVTTGWHRAAELEESGADVVLESLEDLPSVLDALWQS
jgi:phosphoglycolate phosphatase-like HAD superfamily hydrolase